MPEIIDIKKILDPRGNLSFIQDLAPIPFNIARAYWIYDVPGGELRHGHAFRTATEFIVALSGSFDVITVDANGNRTTTCLNRSYRGLLVEPMTWRSIENFSTNAVALVLSSTPYCPEDYIYDCDRLRAEAAAPEAVAFPAEAPYTVPDRDVTHARSLISDCCVVELPRHRHPNGSLSVVDNANAPFPVRRVFYLYDVPGDAERGGHSHYQAEELIVALSGSFDVTVTDGHDTRTVSLNRPYRALYIPAGVWRNLDNFSSGSVCFVLTSRLFSESDYCRDYQCFKELTHNKLPR